MSEAALELKKRRKKRIASLVRSSQDEEEEIIRGPLGIWFFPILNAILRFIRALRRAVRDAERPRKRTKIYQFVRDEKGRIIEILEHELE